MSEFDAGEIEGFLRSHGPFENPPLLANGDKPAARASHGNVNEDNSRIFRQD